MADFVLGMNPITFSLALLSLIGFLVSIITFAYHFDPIDQHLSIAQELDQLWRTFRGLEHDPNYLPMYYHEQLSDYLESLEQDIQILMPHVMPTCSVWQRLKGWFYVWDVFCLSQRTKKAKIALLSMIRHTIRLTKAKKSFERETIDIFQCSKVEATVQAEMNQLVRSLSTGDKDLPSEDASMRTNETIHAHRRGSLPLERRDSWLFTPTRGISPPKRKHSRPKSSTVPNLYSESRSSLLSNPQQPAQVYHPLRRSEAVA